MFRADGRDIRRRPPAPDLRSLADQAAGASDDLAAALVPWLVARCLVAGALALSSFVCSDLGLDMVADMVAEPVPRAGDEGRGCGGLLSWDAGWYRAIAIHGYQPDDGSPPESVRFFPLVSLLARAIALPLGGRADWALLVVANIAALALGAALHRLALKETGDADLARRATWLLALAPPAFSLVMGYAEPLAMALAVGAFWGLRGRRWGWAALAGMLAGLARPVGLLLFAPALVEAGRGWGQAEGRERVARLVATVAPLAGGAAYLAWVGVRFGDPWAPFSIQQQDRLRGGWANPVSTLVDATRGLVADDRLGTGLHVPWALGLLVLVVVAFRRWPASYGTYAAVTVIVALSSTNLDSLERYALGAFPLVLAAASVTRGARVERAVEVLSAGALMGYATLAFLGAYIP